MLGPGNFATALQGKTRQLGAAAPHGTPPSSSQNTRTVSSCRPPLSRPLTGRVQIALDPKLPWDRVVADIAALVRDSLLTRRYSRARISVRVSVLFRDPLGRHTSLTLPWVRLPSLPLPSRTKLVVSARLMSLVRPLELLNVGDLHTVGFLAF